MSNSNKQTTKWLGWLIGLIAAIIIILICWFLFKGEETYTTEPTEVIRTTAIECMSSSPDSPFFNSSNAESAEHTIKATFNSNKPTKLSYNYDAMFSSESAAQHAHAILHGQYNKYMASVSLNPSSLSPSFADSGTKVKIDLITNVDKLKNDNLQFFFLNMDDFQRIKSYNEKELASIYNKKGFSCEIHK